MWVVGFVFRAVVVVVGVRGRSRRSVAVKSMVGGSDW